VKYFKKLLVLFLTMILVLPVTVMAGDVSGTVKAPGEPAAVSDGSVKIFETPDGVLSIEVPADNDKWTVMQDDQKWFAMSDGKDTITVEHYSNGEALPPVTLANDKFVQVYQVYFSTENEVFIVTGEVTSAEDMSYVRNAVNSFKVLKYDTKKKAAVTPPEANYGIREIESDMYCNTPDGVNVRASWSTDSNTIGGISYKEKVYVIGEVTKDGADTRWLKIKYGDREGYVYDAWFDTDKPADPERSGEEKTVYSSDGTLSRTIYFYNDGVWRDDAGNTYSGGMSAEAKCSDGTVWYEESAAEPYVDEPYRVDGEITLYREDNGSTKEIYYYSDNQWRDEYGRIFYAIAEHTWDVEGHGQYFWYDDPALLD